MVSSIHTLRGSSEGNGAACRLQGRRMRRAEATADMEGECKSFRMIMHWPAGEEKMHGTKKSG